MFDIDLHVPFHTTINTKDKKMRHAKFLLPTLTVFCTFLAAQDTHASIITDEVTADLSITVGVLSGETTYDDFFNDPFNGALTPPATFSGSTAVVTSGGPEFYARDFLGEVGNAFEVDINDGTVTIRYTRRLLSGIPDFSLTIADLDWVDSPGMITSLTASTGNPLDISTSFTADSLSFNFELNSTNSLDQAEYLNTFTFEASHDQQPPSSVPEPSAFALLGIGSLALVGYGWRRKRARAV